MNQLHRTFAIAAATLGCAAAVVSRPATMDPVALATEIDSEADHVSALDLAEQIMRNDSDLRLYDLRSLKDYEDFHIPSAQRATIIELMHTSFPPDSKIVLYSAGGAHAAQAWVLLRMRGLRNVTFLREGIYEWTVRVLQPRLAVDATPTERAEFERAKPMSRFFGGTPRAGVSRTEVMPGYWTGAPNDGNSVSASGAISALRRQGC